LVNAQECHRFFAATSHDTSFKSTAARKTVSVFKKSGAFADAIRTWHKQLDPPEWTWVNLKTDISQANWELLCLLTSDWAGYHGANSAAQVITATATAAAA
jgi:hypothetical protein